MKWLTRNEINDTAWDEIVRQYACGLPYAYSFYLDTVTEGRWEALMAVDGSWIWPLPYNRKFFGCKQYYQPFFCQQLGFIGRELPRADVVQKALQEARRRTVRMVHAFNETNRPVLEPMWQARTNLVLPLRETYDIIRSGYKNNVSRRIRNNTTLHIRFDDDYLMALDRFMQWTYPLFAKKDKVPAHLIEKLLKMTHDRNLSRCAYAENEAGVMIGSIIYLITDSRIILLFISQDPRYKKDNSSTFLIDALINKYAGSGYLLDFEGSELENIAHFYKPFGTENQPYGTIRWVHPMLPLK